MRLSTTGLLCGALTLALAGAASAQSPMQMVERALRATEQVQDYTATVAVTVDAPNLQIPRRTAKVYYKRPDKVHVESQGLTVIPRDALLLGNLADHLQQHTSASLMGTGQLGGRPVHAIKLSPTDADAQGGRVLVWIDSERYLLLKSEIWRGSNKMLTARFEHARVAGAHWMPQRIVCDVAAGSLTGRDEGGRIELQFSNYRINTGLPDSIFEGNG
ncbi:MAG: outer membrane lipoprotein-sorting protein [candidate division WS1 bacterium]|nr:outer membrane lipoprotein-sorting protein [candidate division WS1 bacterium]